MTAPLTTIRGKDANDGYAKTNRHPNRRSTASPAGLGLHPRVDPGTSGPATSAWTSSNTGSLRGAENRWTLERVYVDAGISGSTPLARRPEGAKLLAAVRPGDVVIAAKLDRMFRNALDALQTIQTFKRQRISLWLLDLGDVCNGANELIVTVLAAVAQHERGLISERIRDAKTNLRRNNKHQGGGRPFGWRFGEANGHGRACELIPDPEEQAAIDEIIAMRAQGRSLMAIRDAMRARGFPISHQLVANTIARHAAGAGGAA